MPPGDTGAGAAGGTGTPGGADGDNPGCRGRCCTGRCCRCDEGCMTPGDVVVDVVVVVRSSRSSNRGNVVARSNLR